jgi:hypothetical protein
MTILNQQLRETFLGPQMKCYFEKKLPGVSSAEIDVRVEETLKFPDIATYCHSNIPASGEIDDIWHYWILETRNTISFARRFRGESYTSFFKCLCQMWWH